MSTASSDHSRRPPIILMLGADRAAQDQVRDAWKNFDVNMAWCSRDSDRLRIQKFIGPATIGEAHCRCAQVTSQGTRRTVGEAGSQDCHHRANMAGILLHASRWAVGESEALGNKTPLRKHSPSPSPASTRASRTRRSGSTRHLKENELSRSNAGEQLRRDASHDASHRRCDRAYDDNPCMLPFSPDPKTVISIGSGCCKLPAHSKSTR